jgi:hypothetical protein
MGITAIGNNIYKNILASGKEVELGDSKSAQFKPHLKFKAFGECEVGIGFPGITSMNPVLAGDTLTAENTNYKFEWLPTSYLPPYNEFGGYDWRITLKKKPGSVNTFDFQYDAVNVVAGVQLPLTIAQINEGCARPVYAINSIAFYHASKGGYVSPEDISKGITTGKLLHLYRMLCTDALGATAYLDWSIPSTGIIRATINAAFLASATYPVVIAPFGDTFGYTSIGVSTVAGQTDNIRASGDAYTGVAGTATKMSMYINTTNAGSIQAGIYKSADNTLLATTNQMSISASFPPGWTDLTFASNPTTLAVGYLLGYAVSEATTTIYYDDGVATNLRVYNSYTWGDAWTSPQTWYQGGEYRKYSITVTVTPGSSWVLTAAQNGTHIDLPWTGG